MTNPLLNRVDYLFAVKSSKFFHDVITFLLQHGNVGLVYFSNIRSGCIKLMLQLAQHFLQLVGVDATRILANVYLFAELGQFTTTSRFSIRQTLCSMVQSQMKDV